MTAKWWSPCRVGVLLVALVIAGRSHAQTKQGTPADQNCDTTAAQTELAARRFAQSADALRAEIAAHPQCAQAHYLLAESLLRLGAAKDSLAAYTAAAQLRTPTATDLRNVALDYVLLKDYPDATRWATRARDLAPQVAENWYVLGRIDYTNGDFHGAVDCFERTLRLDPQSVKAEDNLGLAYEGLGRDDDARAAYRAAIALGERSAQPSEQPYINLAILLMHQPEAPEALALLRQATALAPKDVRAHEQLGRLYLKQQQLPLAQAEVEQAVALAPQDSRLHFLLGQVYRKEGLNEKARAEFAQTATLVGAHSTPSYLPKSTP